MKRTRRSAAFPIAGSLAGILFLVSTFSSPAAADVEPGEAIDRSNFQKIEGLVPDYILEWVKNGDLTMKIGKQNFHPGEFWPAEVKENRQANLGRYKVDGSNGILEVGTGKPARGIRGIPFPEPDPNDPAFPQMLLWNRQFQEYFLQGAMHEMQVWLSITRRGLEKTLMLENLTIPLDPARNDLDYAHLTVFREPFNMAGVGTLAIYSLYPLKDGIRYAYTPELRRLKRMSHRISGSDMHFGLDNGPDDCWAGGPKTNMEAGVYKYLGEKEALVPYISEDPRTVSRNSKGEIDTGYANTGLNIRLGYEDPDWKGAPWHPVDLVWLKSRVWMIESRSTTPGYAYGPCEGWIEQGSLFNCYKRVADPNGKLWKGVYWPGQALDAQDGKFRLVMSCGWYVVDVRRDHGSALVGANRKGAFRKLFVADVQENLFTQAGFVKFSR